MFNQILFFLASIGVFNAFLVSVFCFCKKNIYLGMLLFFLCIRVGVSCFYFFSSIPFIFIKLGLIANLLLGPSMWSLSKIELKKNHKLRNRSLLQLIIFILLSILSWLFFDFDIWDYHVRYGIHIILTVYLIICAIILRKKIFILFSPNQKIEKNGKVAVTYVALVIVCLGFVVSIFTTYIIGPIIFSITFYITYGFFFLYSFRKNRTYPNKIDANQFDLLKDKLDHLMEKEKVFKDTTLTLGSLANRLGVSKHFLSQVLNDNLDKGFHQYINEYRINESCQLLLSQKQLSIEAIGYDVGFNSKSSFYSIFKKLKGVTPGKYKSSN